MRVPWERPGETFKKLKRTEVRWGLSVRTYFVIDLFICLWVPSEYLVLLRVNLSSYEHFTNLLFYNNCCNERLGKSDQKMAENNVLVCILLQSKFTSHGLYLRVSKGLSNTVSQVLVSKGGVLLSFRHH